MSEPVDDGSQAREPGSHDGSPAREPASNDGSPARVPASNDGSPARVPASTLPAGKGLVLRSVLVAKEQVGFLRYLLEGEDGLAFMYSDGSGVVQLLAPESQARALDRLVADLEAEGVVVHLR